MIGRDRPGKFDWGPGDVSVTQCSYCRHRRGHEGISCAAFPAGIPRPILANRVDHRRPIPGPDGRLLETQDRDGRPVTFGLAEGAYLVGCAATFRAIQGLPPRGRWPRVGPASLEYAAGSGYLVMRIRVDGRTAHLNPTQHLDLTLAGLVHLDGPGWGRELPVITWTAPCGTRTELRGFTSDPVVWLLQLRLDAEANRPDPAVGPVEVPCPDAAYRRWLREMDQPAMQPSPILLLDLNYTLAESRHGDRRPMAERVASETYRGWLVEVARMHTTVLITARPSRWGVATLARIEASTGWRPDLACFNDARLAPPEAKARALDRHVLPRFGVDPGLYLGLESNPATREMYARRGIASVEARSPSIVAGALAAWMARNAAPRP